jgi:transposase-like protein
LGETEKYRDWTAQQKIEIVLAGLRRDRSVKEICREHGIADTLCCALRDKLLGGGREALAGKEDQFSHSDPLISARADRHHRSRCNHPRPLAS